MRGPDNPCLDSSRHICALECLPFKITTAISQPNGTEIPIAINQPEQALRRLPESLFDFRGPLHERTITAVLHGLHPYQLMTKEDHLSSLSLLGSLMSRASSNTALLLRQFIQRNTDTALHN
jgi:hypothetical protein